MLAASDFERIYGRDAAVRPSVKDAVRKLKEQRGEARLGQFPAGGCGG